MKKLLNKKGFTIVELVIVIAVIAILAAVLIPTFSNVVDSANETATMQEAKSTLDSYVGFMSAEGSSLPNGTVFIVFDKDATANSADFENENGLDTHATKIKGAYLYYGGGLHKFEYKNVKTVTKTGNDYQVTIGTDEGAKTAQVNKQILWDSKDENGSFTGAEKYNFYFYSAPVKFTEGSSKCRIFAGRLEEKEFEYTKFEIKCTTSNYEITNKEIAINTADALEIPLVLKFTFTVEPNQGDITCEITERASISEDKKTTFSDNKITIKDLAVGEITLKFTVTSGISSKSETIKIKIN